MKSEEGVGLIYLETNIYKTLSFTNTPVITVSEIEGGLISIKTNDITDVINNVKSGGKLISLFGNSYTSSEDKL